MGGGHFWKFGGRGEFCHDKILWIKPEEKKIMKTVAYIRVSKDTQDIEKQRHEILDYTNRNKMHVDEFIDIVISLSCYSIDFGLF